MDVEAFSSRGYRALLPEIDEPDQPAELSKLQQCYAKDVETIAVAAVLDDPKGSTRFAAVATGPGLGEPQVAACLADVADGEFAIWSEDADTLMVSTHAWTQEVQAHVPRKPDDPLTAVLEHVDTEAHAWFAVRLPPKVDEQIRSTANWLSQLAARSTDNVVEVKPSETPSRSGMGYFTGSLHLDEEGLDGRVATSFETRESVDLVHAIVDIGVVLIKHFGDSPETASERLAHELALHTTVTRSGDRIEAHTHVSAEVLADAAAQAHDTLDIQDLLGLGTPDTEVDEAEAEERLYATPESPEPTALEKKLAAAAGDLEPPDTYEDEDEGFDDSVVVEACHTMDRLIYPLEDCWDLLESQLRNDPDVDEDMLRCVADAKSRSGVFACDPRRLLTPRVADQRAEARESAPVREAVERARKALQAEFAAASNTEKNAIYDEFCAKGDRLMGEWARNTPQDARDCRKQARVDHYEHPVEFELRATCTFLYEDTAGVLGCALLFDDM